MPGRLHSVAAAFGTFLLLIAAAFDSLSAQAPMAGGFTGRMAEAHAFGQRVSNGFGDWSGGYARLILPFERDVFFVDALHLSGFRERGSQGGIAHRHDWSTRWFHLLGINAGDGSPLFPRYRADASVGHRWGNARSVQTTFGASRVQSVTTLNDVAALAAVTWYAPRGLVLETGVRLNNSRPGNIRSHRLHGIAMYTPSPRRTFSARVIGGTEGWQLVGNTATLVSFASQEASLAWRERLGSTALSLQLDGYHNPFYTRAGVTLGVARYW